MSALGAAPTTIHRLRTSWTASRCLSPFFSSGRSVLYNEQHQVTFSLHAAGICIVDVATSALVGRLASYGDAITAFAVSPDASIVIGACHSTLIRTWKLEWGALHRLRAEGQPPPCFVNTAADVDDIDGPSVVAGTPLRSWRVSSMLHFDNRPVGPSNVRGMSRRCPERPSGSSSGNC